MKRHRPRRARGPAALAAGLLGVLLLGGLLRERVASDGARAIEGYTPGADLPRLAQLAEPPLRVRDIGLLVDFDMSADRMVLLDPLNHQVVVLTRGAAGWAPALTFGRRGEGPGELQAPYGIAIEASGGIVIADQSRLHRFTADGQYVRSFHVSSKCAAARPTVAAGASGLFITSSCLRRSDGPDTVVAVLHWSPNDSTFIELAADARYTIGGGAGLPLSATYPFVDGDDRHLFGTGMTNCIYVVTEQAGTARADQQCGLVARRYHAPAPPEIAERLRFERARRPALRAELRWPEVLPYYMSATTAAGQIVLLRPYSADSLLLEAVPSRRELVVTPMDGLITCRRAGCLWAATDADGVRVLVLRTERLASLVAEGAPQ